MSSHKEVFALLPWYVNGSLDSNEMIFVEDHLAQCVICSDAIAEEMQIARKIQPRNSDDHHLARMIAKQNRNYSALREAIEQPRAGIGKSLLKLAAPVAVSVVATVAIGIWLQSGEHVYETMTQPVGTQGADVIQFAFVDKTTEQQMRQVFLQVGGNLSGSPSATGIYRIYLHEDADATHALSFLQAQPVIKWVTLEQ